MEEANSTDEKKIEEANSDNGRSFVSRSQNPIDAEPRFKKGDDAVFEDPNFEAPDCDVKIIDRRPTSAGNFEYKLENKATGKEHANGTWWLQDYLKRA